VRARTVANRRGVVLDGNDVARAVRGATKVYHDFESHGFSTGRVTSTADHEQGAILA